MNWGVGDVPTRREFLLARTLLEQAAYPCGVSQELYEFLVSVFRRCGLWDEDRNYTKLCDFCGIEALTQRFLCPDYEALIICGGLSTTQGFADGWGACDECAGLVLANRREELSRRSVEAYYEVSPSDDAAQEEYLLYIRAVHEAFFHHWTGEVETVGR